MAELPPSPDLLAPLLERVFPTGVRRVERVTEGASTWVYRIMRGDETFYLRVLPEVGASFAPEVAIHSQARKLGVKAPDVLWYEQYHEPLGRSVMVITAVPGYPLSQPSGLGQRELDAILIEAGQDIARINTLPVEGFGWLSRKSDSMTLRAPESSYRAFALGQWEADLTYLAASKTLSLAEVEQLRQTCARYDGWLAASGGVVAHGDFDTTAIYQRDGRYTGIIDFGEARGANRWYDLGHYHMRDGEYLAAPTMRPLVCGYGEVQALPEACGRRICFASLLINVRALSRSLHKRPPNRFTRRQLGVLRADLAALAD